MKKNKKHFSIFELKKLWYHIQNRRRTQLFLLIFLMLFVSLTEIISISAVLPFLAALTNPEMLYDIAFIQPILLKMGFTNSDQLPLPMTIVFIIAVVFAGLMRIVLLWTQTHFAYAIGADISIRVYRSALYSPYIEQVSTNSSEFISGISHKTHLVVTQVIMPSLLIISSTMILLAIFMTVIFIQPHAALTILFSIGCIYGFVSFLSKKKLLEHS